MLRRHLQRCADGQSVFIAVTPGEIAPSIRLRRNAIGIHSCPTKDIRGQSVSSLASSNVLCSVMD